MSTSSTLVVLSTVAVLGGCAATMQAQPPTCPPGQVAQQVQGAEEPQGREPGGSAVREANQSADTAANQLNRRIVGEQQQRRNEQQAQGMRYRCVSEGLGSTHQGLTSQQGPERQNTPNTGRASMQPGNEPSPAANQVGQTAAQATGGLERTVRDVTEATNPPGPYRPFAIEVNPLGLFVGGRLSLTGEWVPATHHAIEVSPHFVHTTANVPLSGGTMGTQAFTGAGTELGYRYYTGTRGMNGVFIGPSLIAGLYNAGLPGGNQLFTNVGVAGDVGIQEILWNHLVVGGGVGIEYLQVSHDFGDLPMGPSTIASTGLKPRFLLQAGYGF
ncbi:MAG TPA: hypothetical protein VF765_16840 [Polyangiaceae bacterium]